MAGNPLRWNCKTQGCFNIKKRPKLEVFNECLGGRMINFGDVDGIVEINNHLLLLEWKATAGDIPRGQHIMYERMTRVAPVHVMVVCGNAELMTVSSVAEYSHGKLQPWQPCALGDLKERIALWWRWARTNEVVPRAP